MAFNFASMSITDPGVMSTLLKKMQQGMPMNSSVRRILERGGARKFRKFEINKDQNEKFSIQNQSGFAVQNQMKTKKKGLHSNSARFFAQN